ncbi:unnamed protein product, partial [marine sediment metagenome]
PDSHVLETLSGRGTLFEIFRRDEAIRRLDAVLSECRRNLSCLDRAFRRAKENQKDPRRGKVITKRLGVSAVQLLITDRYVDEDESFFELTEGCLASVDAVNEQLKRWASSAEAVENWLIRNTGKAKKHIEKFKTQVEAARETLSKRF